MRLIVLVESGGLLKRLVKENLSQTIRLSVLFGEESTRRQEILLTCSCASAALKIVRESVGG